MNEHKKPSISYETMPGWISSAFPNKPNFIPKTGQALFPILISFQDSLHMIIFIPISGQTLMERCLSFPGMSLAAILDLSTQLP